MRDALDAALSERGLSNDDFSELMIRLLDRGVLSRDQSKREAELYDRYLKVAELVEDYLQVLRIRILHEPRFQLLRVFPPGAEVPGLIDAAEQDQGGLRERLNQQEVMLILVLRAEYDKALREGDVDELGQVMLSLEALNLAYRNLLGRTLPDQQGERQALLRRMRQLRLIRSPADTGPDSEAWLTIRPGILSLVTDTALGQLASPTDDSDAEPSAASDQEPS
ncbi:DUF4194 domain-containing protein [Halopseudomonas salegens]|uniref:DUF4194 domain-containing protein n=1 Tax=Halopseudomonas salegens TaxID=1434072 RepID=A0A1H2EHN4_9GAMM|nr:DUF4194 domain-containing protein [Halopseudomonas salegens]SDT94627.1 protein of unknown function [Halopseudomonas salegens]